MTTTPVYVRVQTATRTRTAGTAAGVLLGLLGVGACVVAVLAPPEPARRAAEILIDALLPGVLFAMCAAMLSVGVEAVFASGGLARASEVAGVRPWFDLVAFCTLGIPSDQPLQTQLVRNRIGAGETGRRAFAAVTTTAGFGPLLIVAVLVATRFGWLLPVWMVTAVLLAVCLAWVCEPAVERHVRSVGVAPAALDVALDAAVRRATDRGTSVMRGGVLGSLIVAATAFMPSGWVSALEGLPAAAIFLAIVLALVAAPGPLFAPFLAASLGIFGIGAQLAFLVVATFADRRLLWCWAGEYGQAVSLRAIACVLPLAYAAGAWTEVIV